MYIYHTCKDVKRGEWERRGEPGLNFERDFNIEGLKTIKYNSVNKINNILILSSDNLHMVI